MKRLLALGTIHCRPRVAERPDRVGRWDRAIVGGHVASEQHLGIVGGLVVGAALGAELVARPFGTRPASRPS